MAEPPLLSWLLNYSGAPGDWHLGQATPQGSKAGRRGHKILWTQHLVLTGKS